MYFKGFSFIVSVCDPHQHTLTPEKRSHTHVHTHKHTRERKLFRTICFYYAQRIRVRARLCAGAAIVLSERAGHMQAGPPAPSAPSVPSAPPPPQNIIPAILFELALGITRTRISPAQSFAPMLAHYNLRYINIYLHVHTHTHTHMRIISTVFPREKLSALVRSSAAYTFHMYGAYFLIPRDHHQILVNLCQTDNNAFCSVPFSNQ